MATSARDNVHLPVLYNEALQHLNIKTGGAYIDATAGGGGHSAGILELSAPDGRLLAIDADPDALVVAGERLASFGSRVTLVHSNFAEIGRVAREHGFEGCDGVLFDLGLSSRQLSGEGRGFAFQEDAPLDMRLSPSQGETAADLVNGLPERELADLIFRLGDERASRRIARAIVMARPIETTSRLAAVIERSVGRHGKLHPATKTFLALRRQVNREDESLQAALSQAVELLAPDGRLAVIAFHSGEDRLVKTFLRSVSQRPADDEQGPLPQMRLINRHVIVAGNEERRRNPRSRSARLRVAEKLAHN